ncbi:hypothetical protein OPV22_003674 [Ensete ventricosum]|uniref:SBP-type domain-containing protein n=1 Tax=Ensete ventricosum TaxID=4639 RepID=A0AAV8S193_ENSVE|nr:hypothetical protein OPV22_003674 [Ensete ventricosum]
MMLDYEWGNPAAMAPAMLLFGEENGGDDLLRQHATVFDHFAGHGIGSGGSTDFFPQAQPLMAAALFPAPAPASSTWHQRNGMEIPPLPARIGLNLGVRTYFSSPSPAEGGGLVAGRVCRRRTRIARCQAEGCSMELTYAKHYHRRHKVCEFHSKASVVIVAGLSQRFCQQCSRFHVLTEFDQGKRSCRKRLADHNRRRRKSQELATNTVTPIQNSNSSITPIDTAVGDDLTKGDTILFTTSSCNTTVPTAFTGCKPENEPPVTHMSPPRVPSMMLPLATTRMAKEMALGIGCSSGRAGASSAAENSPPGAPCLVQLGEFGVHHRSFTA